MLHQRRLLALLPLAALALAAPTPAFAAKPPKGPKKAIVQKYKVTFSEKRTVSWDEPTFSGYEDCSYTTWGEAHGREVAELQSRSAAKMVVFQNAYNPTIQSRFGTWSIGSEGRSGRVDGKIDRQAQRRVWYEGGTCGDAPPQPEPEPDDCGQRKPTYDLDVGVSNGQVGVSITQRGMGATNPMAFTMCELLMPDDMPESLDPEPKKMPSARFLKPGGGITVTFHKSYKDQAPAGARPWTRTGELTWKVTFTPVKR